MFYNTRMRANEGHLTTADGVRLYYETLGSGPQTVVIPNGPYLLRDFERLAKGRTLVAYDVRNRGRSDSIDDVAKLSRGIQNDVDDLEAVRRYFRIDKLNLIGHSYVGLMVMLFAMKDPDVIDRIVQIGPTEPTFGTTYPSHLTGANADNTMRDVMARLEALQKERAGQEPAEFCRKFWSILGLIYVTDPSNTDRVAGWGRCELPNERNFMKYWMGVIIPSLKDVDVTREAAAVVKAPVLTIHGRRDRSVAYGAGRDWAMRLPNARLVTVENGGHAPWVEAPEVVFESIETFLTGAWPRAAETIQSMEP
jgi:proline iminopeptidase